ncbi:MAG: hypothetical protein AAGA15_10120 [Pseudomonadota bacterium]
MSKDAEHLVDGRGVEGAHLLAGIDDRVAEFFDLFDDIGLGKKWQRDSFWGFTARITLAMIRSYKGEDVA